MFRDAASRRDLLRLLAGGALGCVGAGCTREGPMDLLELIPAGGEHLRERGAFELAVQQCELNLLREFGAGTGGHHPDARRYRVPLATDWGALTAFYSSKVASSWRRAEVPEQQLGYRLRVWQRDKAIGAQRLAVALLDQTGVGADQQPFRVVVVVAEET